MTTVQWKIKEIGRPTNLFAHANQLLHWLADLYAHIGEICRPMEPARFYHVGMTFYDLLHVLGFVNRSTSNSHYMCPKDRKLFVWTS